MMALAARTAPSGRRRAALLHGMRSDRAGDPAEGKEPAGRNHHCAARSVGQRRGQRLVDGMCIGDCCLGGVDTGHRAVGCDAELASGCRASGGRDRT